MKAPTDHFDIRNHIQFAKNPTRSGTSSKLVHAKALQSSQHHFYFNRIVRLWNHLPVIDTSFSIDTIKNQLTVYLWKHFTTRIPFAPTIFSAPATNVQENLFQLTFQELLTYVIN